MISPPSRWNSTRLVVWCAFTLAIEVAAFTIRKDDQIPSPIRTAIAIGAGIFTLIALYVLIIIIRGIQQREYDAPEDRDV